MKKTHSRLQVIAAMLTVAGLCGAERQASCSDDFPKQVPFELGDAEFSPGDAITIRAVSGTNEVIATGQTYCVEGEYTLNSREQASLSVFATSKGPSGPTPVDPRQTMRIRKGTGHFRLIKTLNYEGYLHVSFYPVPSGSAFGGVYFGQGNGVLRNKGWSYLKPPAHVPDTIGSAEASRPSGSNANRALFEYLGDPVEPPSDLNPAYSTAGLTNAVVAAARDADIAVTLVGTDDSEFPFLLGIRCPESAFGLLKEQLRKTQVYQYGGAVSSQGCYVLNIIPYRAYPARDAERISRRLAVRQGMLYDRFFNAR